MSRIGVGQKLMVERIAKALDANLPRMAFQQYGQFYTADPDFDLEAYYLRVAAALLHDLAGTPGPAPGGVHNHGTEEGLGIACPEYLIGNCFIATLVAASESAGEEQA